MSDSHVDEKNSTADTTTDLILNIGGAVINLDEPEDDRKASPSVEDSNASTFDVPEPAAATEQADSNELSSHNEPELRGASEELVPAATDTTPEVSTSGQAVQEQNNSEEPAYNPEELLECITNILNEVQNSGMSYEDAISYMQEQLPEIEIEYETEEEAKALKNVPVVKYNGRIGNTQVVNASLPKIVEVLNDVTAKREKPYVFSAVSPLFYEQVLAKALKGMMDGYVVMHDPPLSINSPAVMTCRFVDSKLQIDVYETYSLDSSEPALFWSPIAFATGVDIDLSPVVTKKKSLRSQKTKAVSCIVMNLLYAIATFACFGWGVAQLIGGNDAAGFVTSSLLLVLWFVNNKLFSNVFLSLFDIMDGNGVVSSCTIRELFSKTKEKVSDVQYSLYVRAMMRRPKYRPIIMFIILAYVIFALVTSAGVDVPSIAAPAQETSIWDMR